MNGSKKLLILGGIALAMFGMLYGVAYALFVEHQTLARMGDSLSGAFSQAALGDAAHSEAELMAYKELKYKYVRQVDVHSHWIGLAMLMIVMGLVWDDVRFSRHVRQGLAMALSFGSILFPAGVLAQTATKAEFLPVTLAGAGTALVMIALVGIAWGFLRTAADGT